MGSARARGTTFVLTDVEGSTRLWEEDPVAMSQAMARHDELIREVVERHQGTLIRERGEGDSSFSVFADATSAAIAAIALQQELFAEAWPGPAPVRVRLAIHTGEAEHRDGDYYGSDVNRCARLRSLAAGGQSIISAATRAQLVAARHDVSLKDLGSHRLKDLTEPEHIYQLCPPGLPAEFPELRGLEAVPNNLPIQLTSFIGRESEVSALIEAVRGARLLTLTGTGGCGKTRLGLQVAAGVSDSFPDGVWFVDLSAVIDPALVPGAVASALGVAERSSPPAGAGHGSAILVDAIVDHLVPRRALLVLDNCEHLLDACGRLVLALLRRTRHLVILATSREVFNLQGEVAWRVPSLPAPDPARLPDLGTLGAYDAVRLFTERARRSNQDFGLTEENARAVAQVCAQVDGIPLALELAAARVNVLQVEQIASRLGDQFRLLKSPSRVGRSRQDTLRAAVDWSYDLLDSAEATMFRRLAIFSGGWSLEAAEAVCGTGPGGEETIDLLGRLIDKSLLLREHSSGRFRLLEPLRQYAEAKMLETGEADELRERHLHWFVGLAKSAGDRLTGSRQLETLAVLDAELENLRAALEWSTSRRRPEALELAVSLRLYWVYRHLLAEGRTWLEAALDAAGDVAPAQRATALLGAGRLASGMADFNGARDLLDRALVLAQAAGLAKVAAMATWYLGQVSMVAGDMPRARATLAEAVAGARRTGDPYLMTVTLVDSARCELELGENGVDLVNQGIAIARANGDVRNTAVGLCVRGRLELIDGHDRAARATLEEAAEHARAVGARVALAEALAGLGELSLAEGDLVGGRGILREALQLASETDDADVHSQCLDAVASLSARSGEAARAARILGAAQSVRGAGMVRPRVAPWKEQQLRDLRATLHGVLGAATVADEEARGQQLPREAVSREALAALV